MLTIAEENYLKAVFKLGWGTERPVGTNALAALLSTRAASVTDMLKRLSDKGLVEHWPYKGVQLTEEGRSLATTLVRRHRLWEVFLVQKLGYSWGEVHDIAEQLEHVRGESLEMRLDAYLKWPRVDPHGDPIPDAAGRWEIPVQQLLSEVGIGSGGVMTGVKDHRVDFLDYLERLGLRLGVFLEVVDRLTFDGLVQVRLGDAQVHWLSGKVCSQVYLTISNHG